MSTKQRKGYTALICDGCGTEIFVDVNMVMVHDELWETLVDDPTDALCDCCMEEKMGRPIIESDFRTVHGKALCNYLWLKYKNDK